MKYLMTFSYDGSNFYGYQRQINKKTVQGSIEDILSKIDNNKITIHASGRTDAGVHAINQKAHFELTKKINLYNLKKHLNNVLNGEIYIKDIKQVDDKFHARYNVKLKEYRYYINIGEYDLFKRNYIYQYNKNLNIRNMKRSSKFLLGEHDFRAFCTDQNTKENCVRVINKIKLIKKKNIIEIIFIGNGFLKYMVRNIVGILIEIGNGKKDIKDLEKVLKGKNRNYISKTAPSNGLYLYDVYY